MTRWAPIVPARMERPARAVLHAIAADLARDPPSILLGAARLAQTPEERSPALASGDAGIALFFAYLHRYERDPELLRMASRHLRRATEALVARPLSPSLHEGFSGIAWTLQHLSTLDGRGPAVSGHDALSDVDEVLLRYLHESERNPLDVVEGLSGVAVYLLERLPRPAARAGLESLVDALIASIDDIWPGCAWRTGPERLDADDLRRTPDGRFDLGMAHGTPGILAALGGIIAAGIVRPDMHDVLERCMRWIDAQAAPAGAPRFGAWAGQAARDFPSGFAWCYGDLGAASGVAHLGLAVGRKDWAAFAAALALDVASRSACDPLLLDAGLCHGTAGVAHQFNRLYQRTGDERFRAASLVWLERTLAHGSSGGGVGGFSSVIRDHDHRDVVLPSPEFLNGAAGIGLALIAMLDSHAPAWDRVLLLSSVGAP